MKRADGFLLQATHLFADIAIGRKKTNFNLAIISQRGNKGSH